MMMVMMMMMLVLAAARTLHSPFPRNTRIITMIAIGYPAETKPPNTWFNEANVHHAKWGRRWC